MRDGESVKQFVDRVRANSVKAQSERNNARSTADISDVDRNLLKRLSNGESVKVIAEAFGITNFGTYSRLEALRKRYGFETTFQLIAEAIRRGWIT